MSYWIEFKRYMNFQERSPIVLKLLGYLGLCIQEFKDVYPFSLVDMGSEVEKFVKLLNHASVKPDSYYSISICYNDYRFFTVPMSWDFTIAFIPFLCHTIIHF